MPNLNFSLERPTLNYRLLEMYENKFVMFYGTQLVVTCYSIYGRQMLFPSFQIHEHLKLFSVSSTLQ